jgi:hypothetical protein
MNMAMKEEGVGRNSSPVRVIEDHSMHIKIII